MAHTLSALIEPFLEAEYSIPELKKRLNEIKEKRPELLDFIEWNGSEMEIKPTFYFLTITFKPYLTSSQRYSLCKKVYNYLSSEKCRTPDDNVEYNYLKVIELHKDKDGKPDPHRPHLHLILKATELPAGYSKKLLNELTYHYGISKLELVKSIENTLSYLCKEQKDYSDVEMGYVYLPKFPSVGRIKSLDRCEDRRDFLIRLEKIQEEYDALAYAYMLRCESYDYHKDISQFRIKPFNFVKKGNKVEQAKDYLGLF